MATSNSIDLSGPTYCVLTGASQGIGRALAVEVSKLLGPNSLMLLLARNGEALAKTASLCQTDNVKVVYESIDLSKPSVRAMNDILINSLNGRKVTDFSTSLIFHNVGSLGNLSIDTALMDNVAELRDYYDLNVFNVIALNTQFVKIFEDVEDRLVIVNITSLCAIKPMSGMAYYCSGKAAREMYFKVFAEEKKHIRVLNYSPGPVETSMINYVLAEAVNENLRDVFTTFKNQGTLLKPDMTAKKCMRVLLSGRFSPGEHVDYFDDEYDVIMVGTRKSLFIFLMGLAWRCRYSMPLLLSGTVAVLGRAFMFQIRVHTVHTLHENELAYYDEEEDQDDDRSWETESTDSWETIVEEVAYG